MSKKRLEYRQRAWIALVIITITVTSLGMAGCQQRVVETTEPTLATGSETIIYPDLAAQHGNPHPNHRIRLGGNLLRAAGI